MWDNNGNNKLPNRLCIKNANDCSISIEYSVQKWLYENLFKESFFYNLPKDIRKRYKGNRGFKIKVPSSAIYHDKDYTIRGFRNAIIFAHAFTISNRMSNYY